jgi:hypothetical protein
MDEDTDMKPFFLFPVHGSTSSPWMEKGDSLMKLSFALGLSKPVLSMSKGVNAWAQNPRVIMFLLLNRVHMSVPLKMNGRTPFRNHPLFVHMAG